MWGVVPVAGEGSRLRSLTGGSPKCLVDVDGRPLLHHLLDRLQETCSRLCVVLPSEGEAIEEALRGHPWGAAASMVVQPVPRGLRDAVSRAAVLVASPALVVMGDTFFGSSLAPALAPLGEEEGGLLVEPGVPDPGEPAGWVTPDRRGYAAQVWKGKPDRPGSIRIAGGFILEAATLSRLAAAPGPGSFEHLVDEVVQGGAAYRLLEVEGPRWNVNTPDQLASLRAWHRARAHGGTRAARS